MSNTLAFSAIALALLASGSSPPVEGGASFDTAARHVLEVLHGEYPAETQELTREPEIIRLVDVHREAWSGRFAESGWDEALAWLGGAARFSVYQGIRTALWERHTGLLEWPREGKYLRVLELPAERLMAFGLEPGRPPDSRLLLDSRGAGPPGRALRLDLVVARSRAGAHRYAAVSSHPDHRPSQFGPCREPRGDGCVEMIPDGREARATLGVAVGNVAFHTSGYPAVVEGLATWLASEIARQLEERGEDVQGLPGQAHSIIIVKDAASTHQFASEMSPGRPESALWGVVAVEEPRGIPPHDFVVVGDEATRMLLAVRVLDPRVTTLQVTVDEWTASVGVKGSRASLEVPVPVRSGHVAMTAWREDEILGAGAVAVTRESSHLVKAFAWMLASPDGAGWSDVQAMPSGSFPHESREPRPR